MESCQKNYSRNKEAIAGLPNTDKVDIGISLDREYIKEVRSFTKENQSIMGRLHSVETMGLLDGPGVRTIFFLQGCPLRCAYCHNPDSQAWNAGQLVTVEDIVNKALRFKPYHGKDGGVTFSGGEPLVQGQFLYKCCEALKEHGISIAVDTSGFGDPRFYSKIFPLIDVMLLDVKAFSKNSLYALVKGRIEVFEKFLYYLDHWGFKGQIWLRHVMLPGISDDYQSMDNLIEIARPIWNKIERVEILPYHVMGIEKYEELNRPYLLKGLEPMDKGKARELQIYANKVLATKLHESRKEKMEDILMWSQDRSEKHYLSEEKKQAMLSEIKNLPLLKELSDDIFQEIYKYVNIFKIEKGNFVFKSGDAANVMYIIVKGHVKIYENTADGREQIYYLYHDGDFVGGLNLLNHKSYLYMGLATDDCTIIALPKGVFDRYMYTDIKVLHKLLEKSFSRIRWAEDLIQRLSTNNAAMKVSALLLRLTESFGVKDKDGIRLDLSINREEMGNYAGLTRETITRKLGEFRDLGYIEFIGNKVIIIKNIKALEDYCL